MISESQIRDNLHRLLRHDLSLDHFEDWIAQQSWNMHKDSSDAAQKLAAAIELRLAEHSSGHLDEPALWEELRQFANPSVVQISFGDAQPRPADEPPNNIIAHAETQVIVFTSHLPALPPVEPFRAGVASSDREQLVELV
jgi:hypothetical protein